MRKSKGRRKIEMAKVTKEANLQVTFSKRRVGLFKKASELCTLCGAEVAVIVFSPAKKVYSFGHPAVAPIINQYLQRIPLPESGSPDIFQAHRRTSVRYLNMKLTQLSDKLEAETKHGEALAEKRKAVQEQRWWAAPIDELHFKQLQRLQAALEGLKNTVAIHNNQFPSIPENSIQAGLPHDPLTYNFGDGDDHLF